MTESGGAMQFMLNGLTERRIRFLDVAFAVVIAIVAYHMLADVFGTIPLSPSGPDMTFWFMASWGFEVGELDHFHRVGRLPLLPFLVSLASDDVFGLAEASVKVGMGLGAALPAAAYLAGVALYGRLAALLPVFWLVGIYDLWQIALWFNGQTLINTLIPLEMALGYWAFRHKSALPHLLLGILLGLMVFSKEQGIAYVAIAFFFTCIPWIHKEGTTWKNQLLRVFLFLGGLAAVVIPLRLGLPPPPEVGSKNSLPIQDFLTFLSGEVPHVARQQIWAPGYGVDWITHAQGQGWEWDSWRGRVLRGMARSSWHMFTPYHGLFALTMGGLFAMALPAAKPLRRPALWGIAHITPGLAAIVTFGYPYHMSFVVGPLVVASAIFPAAILLQSQALLEGRKWPIRLGATLAVISLIGWGVFSAKSAVWARGIPLESLKTRVQMDVRPGYVEAGRWLEAHSSKTARVGSGQQLVHFYADRKLLIHSDIPIPHADCPPPNRSNRRWYMVLDDTEAMTFFSRMGTPGHKKPTHFEVVARFEPEGIDRGVNVYEILVDNWAARKETAKQQGEAPGFRRYCSNRMR